MSFFQHYSEFNYRDRGKLRFLSKHNQLHLKQEATNAYRTEKICKKLPEKTGWSCLP